LAGPLILVVDDESRIRKLVSGFLSRRGYRVRTAGDGQEALALLASDPPRLLITDLNMPRLDGLALIELVRAGAACPPLPIIVLSAQSESPAQALADAYLVKPVDLSGLAAAVEALLPTA
jgi:CheY-like chemotaxis protein